MHISNKISDYDPKELELIQVHISQMVESLQEVDAILEAEIVEPTEPTNNVLYVNFEPFTEFNHLKDVHLPFDKIVKVYRAWAETLWEMTIMNQGNYKKHKRLMLFVMHLRQIVQTFVAFVTPPAPPKES